MFTNLFKPEKGTWVLMSFVAFFGVIIAVNSIFITNALSSYSGVITENPYRKGIAYNQVLQAVEEQPTLEQSASYKDGVLYWNLLDEHDQPLTADVHVNMVLAIKDGFDYQLPLEQSDPGRYHAAINTAHKGLWHAHLKASWNNTHYQTRLPIIIK